MSMAYAGPSGGISGIVWSAETGSPLAQVDVQTNDGSRKTITDTTGHFVLDTLGAGDYVLQLSASGYRQEHIALRLAASEQRVVATSLVAAPTIFMQEVSVRDRAGEAPLTGMPITITGAGLKEAESVLTDDPLRAVQSLPGVASNNDFDAEFSLRGAGFDRVGVYVDGVLLPNPLHSLQGTDLSGSASVFNSQLIDQMDLYTDALPLRMGDRSAGALEVRMRDGNPDQYGFQFSLSVADVGISASGPLGGLQSCTWIAGFRKSYLQYLLAQTLTDPSMAFGIQDEQGRLSCHDNGKNIVSLDLIGSDTGLRRSLTAADEAAQALSSMDQHLLFANLTWLYTPASRLLLTQHAGWVQDSFDAQAISGNKLGNGLSRDVTLSSDAAWLASSFDTVSGGVRVRSTRSEGLTQEFDASEYQAYRVDRYRGSGLLSGGYLQNEWTGWGRRLHVTGGERFDHHSIDGRTAWSPQAALAIRLWPSMQMETSWSQAAQFPDVAVFDANVGRQSLLPMRSTLLSAGLKKTFGASLTVEAKIYERQDRDLLYQPFEDPRLLADGSVFVPPSVPAFENSLREKSRGLEFSLRRAGSGRWNGWLAYTYGHSVSHDSVTGDSFPSDWDQRHTGNGFVSYRWRPSVLISLRGTYGSGFPLPGYLEAHAGLSDVYAYALSEQRNQVRLDSYQRLDVRVTKNWRGERWRKTLYIEGVNVTNHINHRYGGLDWYSWTNGAAIPSLDTMFPILPSVGFTVER